MSRSHSSGKSQSIATNSSSNTGYISIRSGNSTAINGKNSSNRNISCTSGCSTRQVVDVVVVSAVQQSKVVGFKVIRIIISVASVLFGVYINSC